MPRKPRFYLPDVPVHIVQRGHNRDAVFFEDEDYQVYLGRLLEASRKYDCAVHAYVLMTNHVHLLLTPADVSGPTRLMQHVGRHYVPFINHKYGKSGSIWEGRYKASLIDSEAYLLSCMRYIELNPVRAQMVAHPAEYRWSSYRSNAEGIADNLISVHPLYDALANSVDGRKQAYRELFTNYLQDKELKQIRDAWQTGTPLGDTRFQEQVERTLGQKVGQARRGRPSGFRLARKDDSLKGSDPF